jgi:hypothetical protein
MASGRFVNTSIADDDRLARISVMAEYVFLKTIPHLDRDGMITGKPGLLFSRTHPTRDDLYGQTQTFIDEWVAVGLVIPFNTPEGPALFFPGFAKNNRLPHYDRERPSRFPPPPGFARDGTDGPLYPAHRKPPSQTPKKPKQVKAPPSEDSQREPEFIVGNPPFGSLQACPVGNKHDKELDEVMDEVMELLQDEVQDEIHDLVDEVHPKEQEQVKDQEKEEEGGESGCAAPPLPDDDAIDESTLKPGQLLYRAVCEILGWDYKTLSVKSQVQVAAAVRKLMAADYTCEELERFMGEVWALDWRWQKKKKRPDLEEFQAEVGKLRSVPGERKRSYKPDDYQDNTPRKRYSLGH